VPSEVVVRRADGRDSPAVNLRAQQPQPSRGVRPDSGAAGTADRQAHDNVAHHVDHAVIAEVALAAEKARTPAEVEFRADDPFAHRAELRPDSGAAVVEAPAEI